MKEWCDSRGAKLAVINNRGMAEEGWRQYDRLPKLLAVENITAFDSAPQIQSIIASDPVPYMIPQGIGHPNAKRCGGNRGGCMAVHPILSQGEPVSLPRPFGVQTPKRQQSEFDATNGCLLPFLD